MIGNCGIEEDLNVDVALANVAPLIDWALPSRCVRVVFQVLLDNLEYFVLRMRELSAEEKRLLLHEGPALLETSMDFLL